jgi:hypothetical protein
MKKIIPITLCILLLTNNVQAFCGEDAPKIGDLVDVHNTYGLNLDAVVKRQSCCREKGVGNDISTTIVLLQENKSKTTQLNVTMEIYSRALAAVNKKLTTENDKQKSDRNLQAMAIYARQANELRNMIDSCKLKICVLQDIVSSQEVKIVEILDITHDQVQLIPANTD